MKSWRWNINGIFFALALAVFAAGCKTTEQKKADKEKTLVKIYLEMTKATSSEQQEVPIYRSHPVNINIATQPILDNVDVTEAEVVDVQDGFAIRLVFNQHGSRVLENVTAQYAGKRLVVYAAWPEVRWLGAPLIRKRLADGALVFTPDATKEEAERVVRGINNVAKKIKKDSL